MSDDNEEEFDDSDHLSRRSSDSSDCDGHEYNYCFFFSQLIFTVIISPRDASIIVNPF